MCVCVYGSDDDVDDAVAAAATGCRTAWSVFGSADDQLMPISFSFAPRKTTTRNLFDLCAHLVCM